MIEDEMVGWHHQFSRCDLEQALRDGEGQGSLVWYSPCDCMEMDTTEYWTTMVIHCAFKKIPSMVVMPEVFTDEMLWLLFPFYIIHRALYSFIKFYISYQIYEFLYRMVKRMLVFIKVNFGFDGDKNHWHKATSVCNTDKNIFHLHRQDFLLY